MKHTNIWVHWIIFLSVILVYASLWVISSVEWHISATLLTFVLLWVASSAPLQTLRFILGLIIFLLVLQLLFSSYVRDMLLRSLSTGFKWSDWSYLLFAVERLAWPLMIVTIFQSQLNDPRTAASLSSLLTPFRFLGINIARLQSILLLAMRFMPILKKEWDRLAYFQTYFSGKQQQKGLVERLKYNQGILKAMIAHTMDRAVTTGDLLALRGLPQVKVILRVRDLLLAGLPWLLVGLLALYGSQQLTMIWSIMTLWMLISALTLKQAARA